MTKFLTKAALAATVATGLFASPALAATDSFTARATIVKPLTMAKASDLDFGTITMGAALVSSNVVVARTGGPVASCGANLICTPATQTPAAFNVTGVGGQTLNITLSPLATLVNTADATKNVAFAANPDTTVLLNATGNGSFDIGGSITVLSSTVDGDYSGVVNVTVNY